VKWCIEARMQRLGTPSGQRQVNRRDGRGSEQLKDVWALSHEHIEKKKRKNKTKEIARQNRE